MKHFLSSLVLASVVLFLITPLTSACEYTVRDVGFVDLGEDNYRLVVYLKDTTKGNALKKLLKKTCQNANVKPEIVAVSDMSPQDKLYTKQHTINQYPVSLLVAPKGKRSLIVATPQDLSKSTKELKAHFNQFIATPLKRELLDNTLEAHSVVLLVEGEDTKANAQARKLAKAAIDEVKNKLPLLSKQIDLPPRLMTLSPSQARQNPVLLWSLGFAPPQKNMAQVAVVFGRGRRMENVFNIPGPSQKEFMVPFNILGQDCECSLPREVIRGSSMIPHKWTFQEEDRAAKLLKFDPTALQVTLSVRTILEKRKTAPKTTPGGYQEFDLGDPEPEVAKATPAKAKQQLIIPDTKPDTTANNPEPKTENPQPEPTANKPTATRSSRTTPSSPSQSWSLVMGIACFVAGLIGILIFANLLLLLRKPDSKKTMSSTAD
ncbi:MAG: hypothetical protein ACFCD0_17060 [Gemmataceae bacterium]